MAGVPPVQPSNAQLEDMCERSRVTRRLSQVEGDLETVTRQLTELQRSREVRETSILVRSSVSAPFSQKIVDENKQLKTEVEKLQMEISLHKICVITYTFTQIHTTLLLAKAHIVSYHNCHIITIYKLAVTQEEKCERDSTILQRRRHTNTD